jgi:cell shape-determining protein MreC
LLLFVIKAQFLAFYLLNLFKFFFIILSVTMNSLLFNIQYGVKRFKQFRKKLILDYKKGDKHAHTNPHALPLEVKQ